MTTVHIEELTKKFGGKVALDGISLTVEEGEIFGFVGHNGAGKSTFIHTITGVLPKSSGKITMLGEENLDNVKDRMGVMPDTANLYEYMKGVKFLKFMGELKDDKRTKREYVSLMEAVGLGAEGDKKIKDYSFGMRKKISIAQALLGDPDLIILDEPTSGLDPESSIKIRQLVKQLQQEGKTVFLTSHNLDEIEKISDRVGILKEGRIEKLGTPEELKNEKQEKITLAIRTTPALEKEDVDQMKKEVVFLQKEGVYTWLEVDSERLVPDISKAIIDSGKQLYEITPKKESLEDIFINT
ncbi:ABC transporter ATP-binding protein [Salimicrobium halophilum]|uniref:ABC-2 type transport system ATP-binding protein n=1 Tax=Salimicrobium halophilum TaxID=86666 RepID=A0A1G8R7C2_9BACI|nr:ABC transporter ATP-binding protein [Salimicrobium halophilum]SDJ12733.1 ABC-2 type transport system ATP-binding protein [Salimicrobium halophilum]